MTTTKTTGRTETVRRAASLERLRLWFAGASKPKLCELKIEREYGGLQPQLVSMARSGRYLLTARQCEALATIAGPDGLPCWPGATAQDVLEANQQKIVAAVAHTRDEIATSAAKDD